MSSTLAKTLTEKRQNIWNESMGLLDAAAKENRDLTAEEQEKYDRMSSDLSELRQRIDQIAETERNNAAIEVALRNLAPSAEERSGGDPAAAQEAAIRSFFAGEVRSVEIDRAPGESFRDLTSAVAGATLVPKTFYGQLVERLIAGSGILAAGATVLETGTGEPMEMPVVTSGVTSALVPEGTAIPKSDPVFGKRTLGAFKYGNLVQASIELVNDTKVDLTSWLADECGRSAGATLGADLINGDGVNKPAGLIGSVTAGVTGTAATPKADELIDLFYSVTAPYRASRQAAWLMKDSVMGSVRKLKSTDGQYLWQPALTADAPDILLSKPVHTDPFMPTTAAGAKSVLFGDMSRYTVRLAGGVRFERSDEYAFGNDLVTFRCLVRGDGLLVDQSGAIKAFVGA